MDGGCRPHWMTLLRSCFPNYGDAGKLRKIRHQKSPLDGSKTRNSQVEVAMKSSIPQSRAVAPVALQLLVEMSTVSISLSIKFRFLYL
ncbi:unnamed protein product [Strongylus vulgaris]|uniref:Uncharacterized protein n=1 Tax=Strongylus vulgaris TaxID=40348 RepID=A0A3P7J927_STRVU|nr:unnamed protein product [Strongylus vulgaris]